MNIEEILMENNEEYIALQLNPYLCLWTQKIDDTEHDLYIELSFRISSDDDFGEYCINLTDKTIKEIELYINNILAEYETLTPQEIILLHEKDFV